MTKDLIRNLHIMFRPLVNKVQNMIQRGVLTLVDDSKKLQEVQVRIAAGALRSGAERFQQYGFTAVPFDGAEAVVLFASGHGDHPLVIAVDDRRYRLKGLAQGEVALYDDQGSSIVLKRGGTIEISAVDVKINGVSFSSHVHGPGTLANTGGPVTGFSGGPGNPVP